MRNILSACILYCIIPCKWNKLPAAQIFAEYITILHQLIVCSYRESYLVEEFHIKSNLGLAHLGNLKVVILCLKLADGCNCCSGAIWSLIVVVVKVEVCVVWIEHKCCWSLGCNTPTSSDCKCFWNNLHRGIDTRRDDALAIYVVVTCTNLCNEVPCAAK